MSYNYQSHVQNNRPHSSITMTDLSIYVVPLDLWDEQQNLAMNEIINETISAGFIRVEPEQTLNDIRIEIDQQLGYDFIPKDYAFCKSVGRSLAQVREKQESLLKVKHFLPPNSYAPELFVVDSIITKRSQMTSDSCKTYNSSFEPEMRMVRNIHENLEMEKLQQELDIKSLQNEQDIKRQLLEDENNARLREREIQRAKDEEEMKLDTSRKMKAKEEEFNRKTIGIKPSDDPRLEARRNEIENIQKEIMKRYQELEELEIEHQKKIIEWEKEEERRKEDEEERRRLFEEMEAERRKQEQAIIDKQKEELKRLEEMLKEKHIEIYTTEEQLELERNKREEMRILKESEMENLNEKINESIKPDPEMSDQIMKLQQELEEMDNKQKVLENNAKLEREQAEIDFQKARIEFERLKIKWEEEKQLREREYSERMLEEQRLREIFEQKQKEHIERMENERKKMIEERERTLEIERRRFEEEQKQWDEERIRYEDEERRRLEEMEQAIQDAYDSKPSIPKFELKDPDLILEGASESEQKSHLKNILKTLKADRDIEEKRRDNALKRIRDMQMKIQNRRNYLRDTWKKKYFDEKKKSPPLEEQLNRYKDELESLHRKLINSMEIGMKDQRLIPKHPGTHSPSNKANLLLEAFRIQHDIDDIRQKIEFNQMRLSAERKLRAQTESELKILKIEAMQKKIRLSRTRSDQLAIMPRTQTSDFVYTPHGHTTPSGSTSNIESIN